MDLTENFNKTQKHCSKLWNGMVIRHNGFVFPCCQLGNRPDIAIGNINNQNFDEIVNGPVIQKMRQQSIDGVLPCYDGCDQVKYYTPFEISKPATVFADPKLYADLQIEYGELCNVDCIMCWQDRSNMVNLSFSALKEKLPLNSWKIVNAYGGEVFVMKEAMKHIDFMMDNNVPIMITTNAKALSNTELANRLATKCRGIIVSINAVTEETHNFVMRPKIPFFHQAIENVKKIKEIRDQKKTSLWLCGHFTVVKESLFEFPKFIETFHEMGFDKATIGFDHRYFPNYFRDNPDILDKLKPLVQAAMIKAKGRDVTLTNSELFI